MLTQDVLFASVANCHQKSYDICLSCTSLAGIEPLLYLIERPSLYNRSHTTINNKTLPLLVHAQNNKLLPQLQTIVKTIKTYACHVSNTSLAAITIHHMLTCSLTVTVDNSHRHSHYIETVSA